MSKPSIIRPSRATNIELLQLLFDGHGFPIRSLYDIGAERESSNKTQDLVFVSWLEL